MQEGRDMMDFRKKGYCLYSNSMASNVPLSREASYYQRITREMSTRRSGDDLEKLLEDLKKSAENGECNWATKEPVY